MAALSRDDAYEEVDGDDELYGDEFGEADVDDEEDFFSVPNDDHFDLKPTDVEKEHRDIIANAPSEGLKDPETKQQFLDSKRKYLEAKGTKNRSILHALVEDMNDDKYRDHLSLLNLIVNELPDLLSEKDDDDGTPLHIAVTREQSQVAKELCRVRDDWLRTPRRNRDTCLQLALQKNLDCVEFMIKRLMEMGRAGEVLCIEGAEGNTPLHTAVEFTRCQKKQVSIVELLLEAYDGAIDQVNNSEQRRTNEPQLSPLRYHLETERKYQEAERRSLNGRGARNVAGGSEAGTTDRRPGGSRSEGSRPGPSEIGDAKGMTSAPRPGAKGPNRRPISQVRSLSGNLMKRSGRRAQDFSGAKEIKDLLLLHCMRNRNRDKVIKMLYGDFQQRQIDFDLFPKDTIKVRDLVGYAGHLKFERILQYVSIPKLQVKDFDDNSLGNAPFMDATAQREDARESLEVLKKKPFWVSAGRKDYLAIFEWLRRKQVERILKIIVVDDEANPHSDEVIIESLKNFDVERWDWIKFDICSDVIEQAAPNVRYLNLYCSGNRAVLRSWSSPTGLVRLSKLRSVHVDMRVGFQSREWAKEGARAFEDEFKKVWRSAHESEPREHDPVVQCAIPQPRGEVKKPDAVRARDYQNEQRQKWIACIDRFANFIRSIPGAEDRGIVKIALIDDGVDGTFDDLSRNIERGISYSRRSKDLYNPYYHSMGGHGTIMAHLIRRVCPFVRLYVAKLEEEPVQEQLRITAASAAKAIDWARQMGVQIISMSWTLENLSQGEVDTLTRAINAAVEDHILLFCSSDDMGNTGAGSTYPGKITHNTFRIGAATSSGSRAERVKSSSIDYLFPGSKNYIPKSISIASDEESPTASSLATALASGLAGLILKCDAMTRDADNAERWEHKEMKRAFNNIGLPDDERYIQVWNVFEHFLKEADEESQAMKILEDIVNHLKFRGNSYE
ncbi:MAG: hypothetical protein M1821_000247 [Bathelium mastoideum]|nr:MAG: hypothetical protein M1821_000247 [Bathelium mastoideum]